ncbi:MAG: primosomal protein N' [Rehaibacterium terrae]|uniref:primosomal protein N' n=1 Tax=Rehaibacterium terrae TaxID=1341696 RepID=UPI00391A40DD
MPTPSAAPVLRVALPVPLPRLFDYLPPAGGRADADWIGCRVRVPFGRRELVGVVAETGPAGDDAPELKAALARLDLEPLLAGELLDSLRWAARYYHEPLGQVLATALPTALRAGQPLPDTCAHGWTLTEAGRTGLAGLRPHSRPRRIAERLREGVVAEDRLDLESDDWRPVMRALARRGYVERVALPPRHAVAEATPGPALNGAQRAAVAEITAAFGRFRPLLLEGVTGSGKTEVYLEAIADTLRRGRQALVLVPEIGLTPQTLRRFRARLGVPVHALHSGLADGERARVWAAMWRGQARVLVGTRSAIFCPLPEAGLIVVDEEHDGSYKQQDGLRYSARDLALVRGKALGVPVLLGSATPSLESLHHAHAGRYGHLSLRQRAGEARPPSVRVLDIRKRKLDAGLSEELLAAIDTRLRRGEQVLVFKNRRGYAPVLLCHDCGWSAQCRRCDAPMTVHGRGRRLICHHCGARQSVPPACPACASLALQPQGAGTERIEDALAARFPDYPLVRVDRETTRHRDAVEKHLATLGDGPGLLVGTQILAKGHDLPRLTLVCVVGIDEGLFSADFRAPERLAQLLIQVAGRAGRAQAAGEVILQTHHPEHPLLTTLLAGGYPAFAALELAQREAAGFPPFAHLALLRAEAPDEGAVTAFLRAARAALAGDETVALHGPLPAPMARRAGRHRGQLLLSAPLRPALQARLHAGVPRLYALPEARRVRWSLDVDPLDLY